MLVYGDVKETREAAGLHAAITAGLHRLGSGGPVGSEPDRHAELVTIFLNVADLVGGLLDRDARAGGGDDVTHTGLVGARALLLLARAVDASWRSGRVDRNTLTEVRATLEQLQVSGSLITKPMEGYAFYALYPESYAEAARRSGLGPDTRVIGIRSIGLSLAAMVAAALGAADVVSVRPVGHPFDRRLAVSPALASHILAGHPATFAIVDEGPGLSGSSFAAVADWLVAHGVDRGSIHFFPGHPGDPGRQAGEERLSRWRAARRYCTSMDDLLVASGRLESWVVALIGPLDEALVDISGGAWQRHVAHASMAFVAPQWERRKFLARAGGRRYLVKFAGLGETGTHKLQLARQLHAAGFGPQVAGLCYGFLVQRWIDAPSLLQMPLERSDLIMQLGSYLSYRASLEASWGGASLTQLAEMAIYNTREALGEAAAAAIETSLKAIPDAAAMHRVHVDVRLHPWEWLVDHGRLVKVDALDHARAHDFIGAQDIAWDIAGAIVEHDLTAVEASQLIAIVEAGGPHRVDRALLDFLLPCYLAFQLGAWSMASGPDAAIVRRYVDKLGALAENQNMTRAFTKPSGRSRVALSASSSRSSG